MIMMTGGETRKPRPVASWGDSRTNHSRWPCALPPISYRFRFNGSNAGVRNATMWKWSAHGSSKPAGCQLKQRTSIEFAFVSLSRARRGCLLLLLRFPRRQIWCWAEIKQAEREEKKRKIWVERLFFCICLYMYIISLSLSLLLSPQCGCTFSNQSMHTHKYTWSLDAHTRCVKITIFISLAHKQSPSYVSLILCNSLSLRIYWFSLLRSWNDEDGVISSLLPNESLD